MSRIIVTLRNSVEFNSDDPVLLSYLSEHGYSMDDFLDDDTQIVDYLADDTQIIDYILKHGKELSDTAEIREYFVEVRK